MTPPSDSIRACPRSEAGGISVATLSMFPIPPLSIEEIKGHLATRSEVAPGAWRTVWPGGLAREDRGRPLFFLDIDGVLHLEMCSSEEKMRCWPLVERALDAAPFVDVVWTSNWRYLKPWTELMSTVPERLSSRFIGATPANLYGRGNACPPGPRRIEAFHSTILGDPDRPWIAVDDQPVLYGPDGSNRRTVLYCNPRTGLMPEGNNDGYADVEALTKELIALSRSATPL